MLYSSIAYLHGQGDLIKNLTQLTKIIRVDAMTIPEKRNSMFIYRLEIETTESEISPQSGAMEIGQLRI
jgi:hypothetical protein